VEASERMVHRAVRLARMAEALAATLRP